jgi:uncharacterized caspase-like protein
MNMRLIIITLSTIAILFTANAAKADRRIAFVAGNGAYKNTERLPNAPASAKAMEGLLQNLGFEVVEGIDLTREAMTERLLEFGRKAEGADLALFYYAGQGVSIGGVEYLLPVDADVKSEMDLKLGGAINVDLTVDQTMGDAKVKLVFLDTSRNNPFPAPSGKAATKVSVKPALAEMKASENTMTAFATAPGRAAPDGPAGTIRPFTRALIANIAAPGVEIQQAMTKVRVQVSQETQGRQASWGHTNFPAAATVYLNPAPAPASAPAK